MAQSIGLKALIAIREELKLELSSTVSRINYEISEIQSSIDLLSGCSDNSTDPALTYDDESVHYIKSSQEEF